MYYEWLQTTMIQMIRKVITQVYINTSVVNTVNTMEWGNNHNNNS